MGKDGSPTASKRCRGACNQDLPATAEYFPTRAARDGGGLRAECRECFNSRRRERYASNYEPLRVDEDFDVSVGNVPETPAQAAERGAAAAEKRQEYNRRMGQTLEGVRAVAEGVESDLGPEVMQYISQFLSEQERRFGNRRLARSTAISLAHEWLGLRWFKAAAQEFFSDKITPVGYAARKKPPPARGVLDRTQNLLLSDLHLGADLSGVDNPEPFRRLEESRRLAWIIRQALDYKPHYRDRTLLRVWLNGDVIQGLLGWDMRDGAPLTEQMVIFWHLFRQALGLFSAAFPRVEVIGQPGNHGRDKIRHPGRATSSKWDGHEWRMMYALSMMCSSLPNVSFELPLRAVSVVDCYGSTIAATHGDTEVPLANPTTKHDQNVSEFQKINATRELGREVDVWLIGHFHSAFLAPGTPTVLYNGMLVPPDGHARSKGYRSKPCGQWIFESVQGRPLGDSRFVYVGPEQDNDESLDSILTPPKFGGLSASGAQ